MRKAIIPLVIILGIALNPAFGREYHSIIVKVKNNDVLQSISNKFGGTELHQAFTQQFDKIKKYSVLSESGKQSLRELSRYYLVNLNDAMDRGAVLAELKQDPGIISAEPNYICSVDQVAVPNDPEFKEQWALKNLDALKAWEKATGKGVRVGVVDTGIEWDHPDLKDNVWINEAEDINKNGTFEPWPANEVRDGVSGDLDGIDEDGNGYYDDVIGYDFVDQSVANIGDTQEQDPIPEDENKHGTLVSGVIAAVHNNHIGVTGLAYDAKIVALRAFDYSGNGETDDIARAIIYGALNGIKVLNFSFGEENASPIMHDAIKLAYSMGCVMSASSGNNGWSYPHYPSNYDEVISVGSSDIENGRYYLSNYGQHLSLIAPGVNILTTTLNGGYLSVNGTSFAAPQVSSVAAMLLELNKNLTNEDIKGVVMATAEDAGPEGWDLMNGSGVLNAANAVNNVGYTNLFISYPISGSSFDREKTKEIAVEGSVATPLFDHYQILITEGRDPDVYNSTVVNWDTLTPGIFDQNIDTQLVKIDISDSYDTTYTLNLVVYLKNKNTIEKRVNFEVYSSAKPLKYVSIKHGDVWHNEKRSFLVAATTNNKANFFVKYRPAGSTEDYRHSTMVNYFDYFNSVLIDDITPGITYEAEAVAYRQDGDTIRQKFEFISDGEAMPIDKFILKTYKMPMSYVINAVADLYGDGTKAIVTNELENGDWKSTKAYKFINNEMAPGDSIPEIKIPVGIGDSNGDGIPEIFTKVQGRSTLYQRNGSGSSPFSKVLYQSTNERAFWAADIYDIDHDGRDELIGYSDTSVYILKYIDGSYHHLGEIVLPERYKFIGTLPGITAGDFDDDGNVEICISTEAGNLFIYEYNGSGFRLEYSDTQGISSSNQYMCRADIDGDGTPEILTGNFGSKVLYGYNEVSSPIWTFRVIKSIAKDTFDVAWEEQFYGVRASSLIKNGVAAGDLNNIPGDEIVISAFPNLYIFTWDVNGKKMKPVWWYPNSMSNSAIIYDFDGNGTNEIGFTTGADTRFFEMENNGNNVRTPTGFDGWATSPDSVHLFWEKAPGAVKYEIIRLFPDYTGIILGETSDTSIEVGGLEPFTNYDFVIRSIGGSDTSEISYILSVFTHNPAEPAGVSVYEPDKLLVSYNGSLPEKQIDPSYFRVVPEGSAMQIYPQTVNLSNDTLLLLSFAGPLSQGNYSIHTGPFRDYYGSPAMSKTIDFIVPKEADKAQELYLKRLEVLSKSELLLKYSENISPDNALNADNYEFRPYGKAAYIDPDPEDSSQVFINLDPAFNIGSYGINYTVTVTGVSSSSGNKITEGPGNTLGFVFSESNLNDVFVYPNPVKLNESPKIYFANLTRNAEVTILTLEGRLLRTLTENDGNGGVEWDGRDKDGNLLHTGVYIYKVSTIQNGKTIETGLKKFAVIK